MSPAHRPPVSVTVVRSGRAESRHVVSVAVLDPDGQVVLAAGDVGTAIFPRSSNKPLQAVGLLRAGWVPQSQAHLALAAASHSGEPHHLATVQAMLADVPGGAGALQCPVDPPLSAHSYADLLRSGGAASRLTMNCSGKHAAMLATAHARGWSLADYLDPAHPVQRACAAGVQDLAGEPVASIAVDGCGAPQHAISLVGLARAFRTLARAGSAGPGTGPTVPAATGSPGPDADVRAVADAIRSHPWLVGGTGRDVTRLLEALPGSVAKDGAEGVFALALPAGATVALKVADGAERARTPVLLAALRQLGVELPDGLRDLEQPVVLGGGRAVGQLEVSGFA